jgi:hypothetical protein
MNLNWRIQANAHFQTWAVEKRIGDFSSTELENGHSETYSLRSAKA